MDPHFGSYQNKSSPSIGNFLCFSSMGFIILFLIFKSALFVPFVPMDQLRTFRYGTTGPNSAIQAYEEMRPNYVINGRPLLPVGEAYEHGTVHQVEDLSNLRLFSILLAACGIGMLSTVFLLLMKDFFLAFMVSSAIYALPGMSFFILQGGHALPIHVAVFLSFLGYFLFYRYNWNRPNLKGFANLGTLFFCVFLVIALNIYQPFAFCIFLPMVGHILFANKQSWPEQRNLSFQTFVAVCLSVAIYFSLAKTFIYLEFGTIAPQSAGVYKLELDPSFYSKLPILFLQIIPKSVNLWNIYYNRGLTSLFFTLLSIALIIKISKDGLRVSVERLLICFFFILASLTPWLMSHETGDAFRFAYVGAASAVVIGFWSLMEVGKKLFLSQSLCFMFWGIAVCTSSVTTDLDIWNSALEYRFVKHQIYKWQKEKGEIPRRIHIIPSDYPYNGRFAVRGEIHVNPLCLSAEHTPQMVVAVLRDLMRKEELEKYQVKFCTQENKCTYLGDPTGKSTITVTRAIHDTPAQEISGTLIIDLPTWSESFKSVP